MAALPILGAIGKEILLGLGIAGALELGGRGIGWLWRKASAKWAAKRGAQAAAGQIAQAELRNIMQKALTNLEQRIAELRTLAEQARAAGNMTLARSYERQLSQLLAEYSTLAQVAHIGREKLFDRFLTGAGLTVWLGHLGIEWKQATTFGQYAETQERLAREREPLERAKLEAQWAMIQAMKERMLADERNRAFWAWYLQQKQNLELMRQQALAMKRSLAPARRRAGSRVSKVGEKILLEQVKAYYKALADARKRLLEWEKFYQAINLENIKAEHEKAEIMLRAKWDAWVDAVKTAHQMQEELYKTVLAMTREYQEAALKSQLQREEYALKAQLEQLKTMLAEHKMRLEHALEMEKLEIKGQYERTNTAIAQAYENVRQYLKTVAELGLTKVAKEVTKSGKGKASEIRDEISEETRRILVDYGKELLQQLKRAGKLSLEPRKIVRGVAVYDPATALAWLYRR